MKIWPALNSGLLFSGWAAAIWLYLGRDQPPGISVTPPSVTASETEEGPYRAIFHRWASEPALAGASIGFCLLDETGTAVFASALAETALCPASALKTLTTAAALELLGPEFRFTTSITAAATISGDGILRGDLVLIGGGDPTLSTADLHSLADSLLAKGLKQVTGTLRPDESAFPAAPVNDHWNWGDIGNGYGAGAYAINLDHNRLPIRFAAGAAEGDPARLLNRTGPTQDTRWANEVRTGPPGSGDRVVAYSEPRGRVITLHGTVPIGAADFAVSGALPDPPARALELLRARLEAGGVRFSGQSSAGGPGAVILASHQSAALPEILGNLHRVSDNLEAQCLFLAIGQEKKSDPASAIRGHWAERGVAFAALRMIDGSGLARANMIRPVDLAMVNHLARRGPHGGIYFQSLNGGLDGRVRAKLGAMSGVKTDVGFITMADGREFTFALMANGLDPALSFWPRRDALLREVAGQ